MTITASRIALYVCAGGSMAICVLRMIVNYRRKMQHLLPGTSWWAANTSPGRNSPELYTPLGNQYRLRELRYQFACVVIAILWIVADEIFFGGH